MGAAQVLYARRQKAWLLGLLGNACVRCGSTVDLEFDVILPDGRIDKDGKPPHHRKMSWDTRMRFYTRQYFDNNLQLLCSKCNGSKKNKLELRADDPF